MDYLRVLQIIHEVLHPNNYLEIGCRFGASLCISKCRSIAVDPDYEIQYPMKAPTSYYRMISDQFFQQYDIKQLFNNPIDLAFIDGMHNAEYVVRDFMNIEKNCHPGSVILIDDVLPEKIEWTTRDRLTQAWTGDVYQVIPILRQYRTDLQIQVFDVDMKGMALVFGINSTSTVLCNNYLMIEKAILSGNYRIDSAELIRRVINPISTNGLTKVLSEIKSFRDQYFHSS